MYTLLCQVYNIPAYLDLHIEIDSKGRLKTKIYDKGDDSICPL